jgi:hypothetical protein
MALVFSRQIFEISSDVKYHENPSIGAQLFYVDGQTHRGVEEQTDISRIIAILPKHLKYCDDDYYYY